MNAKQKVGCLVGILTIFVSAPIWYYLLYQILKSIDASDVMWLLYWIYLPAGVIANIIQKVAESIFEDE